MTVRTEFSTGAVSGHKASMDRMYRYQRHIYDATRACYLLGRDKMIADLKPPEGGLVLEIGCGTGRNLVQAALRYPNSRFVGIDISDEMLKSARSALQRHGLDKRVSLLQADAGNLRSSLAKPGQGFDRIFFSYTLSMIPVWQEALQQARDYLRPSGQMHIVDFGQGQGLPDWSIIILRKWLDKFGVHPRDDLPAALEAIAERTDAHLNTGESHRGYAVHAVLTARP